MRVIFIFGPAASGKHTIGSLLSEELQVPLFHNHLTVDLAASLFEFGSDGFKNLRASIWMDSFRAAATAGQSFIFTFHPEKTVQPELIKQLQEIVEDCGGDVQYIQLLCSENEVENRLTNESRAEFGKLRDLDLYRTLREFGQFEYPYMPKAHLAIDSEQMNSSESARIIAEYIQNLEQA